jgi:pyruvate formate lyase activating enzyme
MDAGLRYVYTGNVHDREGDATHCPGCGKAVIERDWYEILSYDLDDSGRCKHCGTALAGRFTKFGTPFGARRQPVVV